MSLLTAPPVASISSISPATFPTNATVIVNGVGLYPVTKVEVVWPNGVRTNCTNLVTHGTGDRLTCTVPPAPPNAPSGTGQIVVWLTGGGNLLTGQQCSLEDGTTTGWSLSANSSFANSTAQAVDGTHCLAVTAVATGDMAVYLTLPVVGGTQYYVSFSARAATVGRNFVIYCNWSDAGGNGAGQSFVYINADPVGSWTTVLHQPMSGLLVAPANAARVSFIPYWAAAAAGEVHYIDLLAVVGNTDIAISANVNVVTTPVLIILQGGPLDGEKQVTLNVNATPGNEMPFNVPNWQNFAGDGETMVSQGLEAIYAYLQPGPPPNPNAPDFDTWVTSWIHQFTGKYFVPPPGPIVPPGPQPLPPAVFMNVGTGMTVNANDPAPGVQLVGEGDMSVNGIVTTVNYASVGMTAETSMSVTRQSFGHSVRMAGTSSMNIVAVEGVIVNLLNAQDSDLEGAGVGNWTAGSNCVIANTVSAANTGLHSLSVTSVTAGDMYARLAHGSTGLAAVPNTTYVASASFRSATARTMAVYIQWWDANNNFISQIATPFNETANQWVQARTVGTAPVNAPANAAYMDVLLYFLATGAANEVHYVDTISIGSNLVPYSPLQIAWDHAYWAEDPAWTPPADGGDVASWNDSGKQGTPITTTANYPTFKASDPNLNGQPSVVFGVNSNLLGTAGGAALNQPGTVVGVFYYDGTGLGISGERGLFDGGGAGRWLWRMHSGGNTVLMYAGTIQNFSTALSPGAYLVVTNWNGAASNFAINGGAPISPPASPGTLALNGLDVPASITNNQFGMSGSIAFIGVKASPLSSSELSTLTAWARSHYNLW